MTHCVVGYPSLEENWLMLEAMQKADVDLVELQMPFSEPMADGPLFVKANEKALKNGIKKEVYFDFMKKATQKFSFPIFLMGYYNFIFKLGHECFIKRLNESGGKGFIIPDLPIENFQDLFQLAHHYQMDPILLFSPTSSKARLEQIAKKATGFIYCIARKGVTGKQTVLGSNLTQLLNAYREATSLPLALGFGLNSAEDLKFLKNKVEIAIVGSALLKSWEKGGMSTYINHLQSLSNALLY